MPKDIEDFLEILSTLKGKEIHVKVANKLISGTLFALDKRYCIFIIKNGSSMHAIKLSKLSMVSWEDSKKPKGRSQETAGVL